MRAGCRCVRSEGILRGFTDEMDKTEPRKPCYGSRVRATPWRRAERRLQVPPGGLFIVLPAWSVRAPSDRKSVVSGKRGSVRVDLGGRRRIKKNKKSK